MDEFYEEVGRRALGVLKESRPSESTKKMSQAVANDDEAEAFFAASIYTAAKESKERNIQIEIVLAAQMFFMGLLAGSMTARAICEGRQLAGMMGVPHE
jgi:hypothetical protein